MGHQTHLLIPDQELTPAGVMGYSHELTPAGVIGYSHGWSPGAAGTQPVESIHPRFLAPEGAKEARYSGHLRL